MIQSHCEGVTAQAQGKCLRHHQDQPNGSWGLAAPAVPLYSHLQHQACCASGGRTPIPVVWAPDGKTNPKGHGEHQALSMRSVL